MNCCRSSPATGGSGRRLTAAARSRNRASISSTSSEATAATVPGAAERHSGRPASPSASPPLGTVSGDSRFLHRGLTDLGRVPVSSVLGSSRPTCRSRRSRHRLAARVGLRDRGSVSAASGSAARWCGVGTRRGDVERHRRHHWHHRRRWRRAGRAGRFEVGLPNVGIPLAPAPLPHHLQRTQRRGVRPRRPHQPQRQHDHRQPEEHEHRDEHRHRRAGRGDHGVRRHSGRSSHVQCWWDGHQTVVRPPTVVRASAAPSRGH